MALAHSTSTSAETEPTRRALLNAFVALPVAAVIHKGLNSGDVEGVTAALMQDETPIMAMFREWLELYRLDPADDAALNAQVDQMNDLQGRICAAPSITVADFAAKLVAHTNFGGFEIENADGAAIYAEASALLGVSDIWRAVA